MPNWCEQDLWVRLGPEATEEDLVIFREQAKTISDNGEENPLDEENFLPVPKRLRMVDAGSLDVIYTVWYGDWKRSYFARDGEQTREELKEKYRARFNNADAIAARQKSNMQDFGAINWYNWAIKNQGTKWGICNPYLEENDEDQLMYTFESAWSPAEGIVAKMAEMFPKLEFELLYFEAGMGFNGRIVFEEGEEASHESGPYFGRRGG